MGLLSDLGTVARGWRWGHRTIFPSGLDPVEDRREFPTDWARSPAARAAREMILRFGLGPLMRLEVDLSVHGLEVLDDLDPPAIFVSNHASHLDAPVLLTSLPPAWRRAVAVGAATDYFFDVWWRRAATILVFNAFPIERRSGRRSARKARDLLKGGWSLIVFPEGTRSRDGWVQPLRSGAAWLAVETGIPVVPIGITGSYQAMPPGRNWPVAGRKPVAVRLGRALRPLKGERVVDFQQRLRMGLAVTLDEERTSWWEAIRRAAEGRASDPSGPSAARWRRLWESHRPVARPPTAWPARKREP